ncbi:MAG: GntR family transcriptional regulator [Candidatus Latescibacteria bacterium]|jgi:GntR family transcriptional regulator|nr:GntR family transcriptional regulator [Candidatus Latescibacterota bacterium]
MILNLSELSDEPLQSQISRQIRAKILAGDLPENEALPSIRALAREQHVSVITVQRAYERLEREGLIQSRRRRGFFVAQITDQSKRERAEQQLKEQIEPIIRNALAEGLSSEHIEQLINHLLTQASPQNPKP